MERSTPVRVPSSEEEGPLPLKDAPSLRSLVEEVRAPGANRADVDALLHRLSAPLLEGESARERADALLDLLHDAHLSGLTGGDARPVRAAALEALLALGFPYALEVPPELLAELRPGMNRPAPLQRWNIHLGLAPPLLAAVVECAFIYGINAYGSPRPGTMGPLIALSLATSVLPTLLAFLGVWKRRRLLNALGRWPLGLVGLGLMLLALGLDDRQTPVLFCLGLARLLGAVCLWLPRDER